MNALVNQPAWRWISGTLFLICGGIFFAYARGYLHNGWIMDVAIGVMLALATISFWRDARSSASDTGR